MGKCPTPGPLFYHELGKIVSKQYAISTTVVGLFLKKKKKNSILTFKSDPEFLQPIFGQPFSHEHNILSAKIA